VSDDVAGFGFFEDFELRFRWLTDPLDGMF